MVDRAGRAALVELLGTIAYRRTLAELRRQGYCTVASVQYRCTVQGRVQRGGHAGAGRQPRHGAAVQGGRHQGPRQEGGARAGALTLGSAPGTGT